ncbi:MAG: hypothetical protein IPF99_26035 [Deltaproteobacteria bacterium]|nr:hypothetical protein [Deltaproteobacteria bacterium]
MAGPDAVGRRQPAVTAPRRARERVHAALDPVHARSTPSQRSVSGVTSPSQAPHTDPPPVKMHRCDPARQSPTPLVPVGPL